jgi:hypothetical protein
MEPIRRPHSAPSSARATGHSAGPPADRPLPPPQAPVSGSKKPAIDGVLIILAAGDEALFAECATAFDIMGRKALFLGAVGQGARMKLVVNMLMGAMMGARLHRPLSAV